MANDDILLTDDYVAGLLAKDAKDTSIKYSSMGLDAFTQSKPPANKPKPNTRFLRNIIKDTDSHNATLLAKEAADSRARLRNLSSKEHREERAGRVGGSDIRKRQLGDIAAILGGGPSKRKRSENSKNGDISSARVHTINENVDPNQRDIRNKGGHRTKDEERVDKGGSRRYRNRDEDVENSRARHSHRRRHKSLSPDPDDGRDHKDGPGSAARGRGKERDDRKNRPRSHSRSRSPRKHRTTESRHRHRSSLRKISTSPAADTERAHRSYRHLRSPRVEDGDNKKRSRVVRREEPEAASDSDPLDDIIGPRPIPPTPVRSRGRGVFSQGSGIEARFSASYDPTTDVQLDPDEENDWDQALEALRDRQKWQQAGAARLRAAGFTDEEVAKWEKGGEKREEDVKWSKRGESREWDRGKVMDDEGVVRVDLNWGRLKDT